MGNCGNGFDWRCDSELKKWTKSNLTFLNYLNCFEKSGCSFESDFETLMELRQLRRYRILVVLGWRCDSEPTTDEVRLNVLNDLNGSKNREAKRAICWRCVSELKKWTKSNLTFLNYLNCLKKSGCSFEPDFKPLRELRQLRRCRILLILG